VTSNAQTTNSPRSLAEGLFEFKVGATRRLLNFFSSGLGLLHCSHPSLAWFELPRGSQQRQADNGNTHSIRVCDSRSPRSMKPTHAGPLRASVRPAARGGDLAATSQFCGTPSTPRI